MSKVVYCSSCGTPLEITRKALPKYGRIIDLVPPHECSEELHDVELVPISVPLPKSEEGKFVQHLNELEPPQNLGAVSTEQLRDRRSAEYIKNVSSAPISLLDQLSTLQNSIPAHKLEENE